MILHLFYIDKSWEKRGYAENYNLIVDMKNKTYRTYIDPYCGYDRREDIEVKKKSDITDYIEYLKENEFKTMENEENK